MTSIASILQCMGKKTGIEELIKNERGQKKITVYR